MNRSVFKPTVRAVILLLAAMLFVCDALTLSTWHEQTVPQANGVLGGQFAPGIVDRRLRIVRVEQDGALARAGAKAGDLIEFAHKGTPLRQTFSLTESVPALVYHDGVARSVALRPLASPSEGPGSLLSALLYLVNDLIALALVAAIVIRRGNEGSMLAFAVAMLANSPVTFLLFLPAGTLQDVAAIAVRPLDYVSGYVFFLLFALKFPSEHALFKRRFVPASFYALSAVFLACSVMWRSASLGVLHVPPGLYDTAAAVATGCAIATAILSLAVLGYSWNVSRGAARNRVGWILLSIGTTYLSWIGVLSLDVLGLSSSSAQSDFVINIISLLAYIGFAYALLRHKIFDFGFAVNRTLVFTGTSLLLFLAFWLIEQLAHKVVHFEAADKNAMLGGAIAFGLFFAFNRVHHRVEHWIEHLFFMQWRANELALQSFLAKVGHFTESASLLAAFDAALRHFAGNAGNAIYLADSKGQFTLAQHSLASAPASLAVDDDIAVTLRTNPQITALDGSDTRFQNASACAMIQGHALTGIVIVGAPLDTQQYRPDQLAMLEGATARINLELGRLQSMALANKLEQLLEERERWQRDIEALQQERATLHLALSKVPTPT